MEFLYLFAFLFVDAILSQVLLRLLFLVPEQHLDEVVAAAPVAVQSLWTLPAHQCGQHHQVGAWVLAEWTVQVAPAANESHGVIKY